MKYKGYRIYGMYEVTKFFDLDKDGNRGKELPDLDCYPPEDAYWYTVTDSSNEPVQTFETLREAKLFIDTELK